MNAVARKRRSFMAELLLWILLLVVLPVIALQIFFFYNNFSQMKKIEREKSEISSRSAQNAIENLGEAILGITVTNAYWEENREAMANRDLEWLQNNVADMPTIVPTIDFVAQADVQGNVVVQAGDVQEFKDKIGYPVILERFAKEPKFYGVLNTSKGLAVVAISAVTDEQGDQPPVGLLVTGRWLTNEILQKLSNMLQTDLSILSATGQYLGTTGGLDESGMKKLVQENKADAQIFRMERSQGVYTPQYAAPLLDMAGSRIGHIHTQSPSVSATQAADDQTTLMIYMAVILASLVILVMYLLRRRIVLPLRHFTASLAEVASGKDIEEIPKHVMQAEAEIVLAIQQVMRWNQMLEKTVERRTAEIRNLLDHARQGFLSFGADLAVKEEYSVECLRLFGHEPAGNRIDTLFYPNDAAEHTLFQSILTDYFQQRDGNKREVIFSLLPDELRIGNRTVKVEFVPMEPGNREAGDAGSVMAILTDLTETRQLEDQMQQERRILRMVVQIVTHPEDYTHILRDFERFCNAELWERLASGHSPQENALAVYRMIHTFKGNFAFLQFLYIVPKLHALESELEHCMNNADLTLSELTDVLRPQKLETMLEEDLELLKSVLGSSHNSLLLDEEIRLGPEQWTAIEIRLERSLSGEADREWLDLFRTWRYRPASSLFKPYAAYLSELADRSGVLLKPVELIGGDIPIDPDRLYGFARAFVHVVRNAVVHGIEPPEERVSQGKDEFGTISFIVEEAEHGVRIVFADDGRGIDSEVVKERAARQGFNTGQLTDEEALHLIFEAKMSTSGQVSEWSGRGVGLSVVRDEVERLGGKIEIRTRKGSGTTFVFEIPFGTTRGEERIGA